MKKLLLNLPFTTIEDVFLRNEKQTEYVSYFNDIFWIINNKRSRNPHNGAKNYLKLP